MFQAILDFIQYLVLGCVQGIAEFLPISSSAHLIIFRDVFKIGNELTSDVALVFDVALHMGTVLSIGIFFFKDFVNILKKGFNFKEKSSEQKLMFGLILACIPAAIVGLLFEDVIANIIRDNLLVVASALLIMGVLIYFADKKSKSIKSLYEITLIDSLIIGCSQVFALIPGFSRSGTTIACARVLQIDKESSCKFSFFLSMPVVLGATVYVFLKPGNFSLVMNNIGIFVAGMLASFVAGIFCIQFLLKFIKNNDFKVFMFYRIILAIIVFVFVIFF